MKIFEVDGMQPQAPGVKPPEPAKLLALTQFLTGRAEDESAKKEISTDAFINLAKSLGINLTPDLLAQYINTEPLSNVLEPLEPNSNVVRFKGNTETTTDMDVSDAEEVVNKNAKQALNRRK